MIYDLDLRIWHPCQNSSPYVCLFSSARKMWHSNILDYYSRSSGCKTEIRKESKLFLHGHHLMLWQTMSLLSILAPCQWGSHPDSHPPKLIILYYTHLATIGFKEYLCPISLRSVEKWRGSYRTEKTSDTACPCPRQTPIIVWLPQGNYCCTYQCCGHYMRR